MTYETQKTYKCENCEEEIIMYGMINPNPTIISYCDECLKLTLFQEIRKTRRSSCLPFLE